MLGDGDAIRSASVRALIGKISVNVQEFETAKRYLKTSWKTLKPLKSKPDNIFCSVFTLNQLGLLFSSVERVEKTLKYLNQAEALYEEWKVEGVKFTSLGEIFGCDPDDGSAELEEEHTLTLYYMAQAWRLASCPVLATRYCHRTLARQLQIIDSQNKIEWALNAATLSQVFLEHYMFSEACHHLCAASYVLDLRRAELDADHSEREQHEADLEEYNHRKGDIALCWLKYDIMLLTVSRDRLVQENEDAKNFCQYPDEIVGLMFPNLDLDKYKKGVRVNFVLTYEDARPLFLHGQECANRGKQYYTLNEHASDYIRIQQDLSQLYVGLQFFEDDESRFVEIL
ncbi:hypothetical protein AAG570_006483 [Ranatra chinensis]|uniref:KIF-binding protein n=1 Tax=Ranatra chinensis TaxID=642074 RepID=A0ABD0YU53_9HEMI